MEEQLARIEKLLENIYIAQIAILQKQFNAEDLQKGIQKAGSNFYQAVSHLNYEGRHILDALEQHR